MTSSLWGYHMGNSLVLSSISFLQGAYVSAGILFSLSTLFKSLREGLMSAAIWKQSQNLTVLTRVSITFVPFVKRYMQSSKKAVELIQDLDSQPQYSRSKDDIHPWGRNCGVQWSRRQDHQHWSACFHAIFRGSRLQWKILAVWQAVIILTPGAKAAKHLGQLHLLW